MKRCAIGMVSLWASLGCLGAHTAFAAEMAQSGGQASVPIPLPAKPGTPAPSPAPPAPTPAATPAPAPANAPPRQIPRLTVTSPAPTSGADKINMWGREVTISVPVREGKRFFGNLPLRISVDDVLDVPADQLATTLGDAITPDARTALLAAAVGSGRIRLDQLDRAGLSGQFDPQRGEIVLTRSSSARPVTDIAMSAQEQPEITNYEPQAKLAGYLTARAGMGWAHVGSETGFDGLNTTLSLGLNFKNIVFESDVSGLLTSQDSSWERVFSRFVYDRPTRRERWSLGDVAVGAVGYMGGPSLLGLQVTSDRDLFDPSRNLRPTSFDAFDISQPSDVEIVVNGRVERRLTLDPGQYRLTDFPFANGANEVQIIATDRTGRQQVSRFNRFYDFSLLPTGETTYDMSLGIGAQPSASGPIYDDTTWIASGTWRRGISEQLTFGAGLQADHYAQIVSLEGVAARALGTISFATGLSHDSRSGLGYAGRFTFQRQYSRNLARKSVSSWTLGGEVVSEDFSGIGRTAITPNTTAWSVFSSTNFEFSKSRYGSLSLSYQQPRNGADATYSAQASYGFRLTNNMFLNLQTSYRSSEQSSSQFGIGMNLSFRFGANSLVSASYDSVQERYNFGVSQITNRNVGSRAFDGRFSGGADSLDFNGGGTGSTDRFDYGYSVSATYGYDVGELTTVRSALTSGVSLAFADGSFAFGRPISDSFAIVKPHRSLAKERIEIDASARGFEARSGPLGPALLGTLNAYAPRVFTVSAPDAALGTDLGTGSYRVRPTYRSGYLMIVGSDYVVTAIGTLLDEQRQPVVLATGTAQLAPGQEGDGRIVQFFTNGKGQFGIAGLKPGRWTGETAGDNSVKFEFTIPEGAKGLARLGNLEGKP